MSISCHTKHEHERLDVQGDKTENEFLFLYLNTIKKSI